MEAKTQNSKRKIVTPFAKKVYKAALKIPLGEVRTYKWVAEKIGHPRAFRAVGQALKKNPYPVIIPCHRVIGSSGGSGGFALGRKAKRALLDLERQIKKIML